MIRKLVFKKIENSYICLINAALSKYLAKFLLILGHKNI